MASLFRGPCHCSLHLCGNEFCHLYHTPPAAARAAWDFIEGELGMVIRYNQSSLVRGTAFVEGATERTLHQS